MAIDGLIILDTLGRPIIQSGYTSSSSAYPLFHVDALASALEKSQRVGDIDPVLYVSADPAGGLGGSACCHVEVGGLRVAASVSGDLDPLVAFAFLKAFVEILHEYFDTVSVATLKDNFDIVYQLLEETLDSSGHPLTTYPNALRDIVLPPSLLNKLLTTLTPSTPPASGRHGPGAGSVAWNGANAAFASPIPWRKAGSRYNNNEVYLDIVEEMRSIVGSNGATLVSNVWGKLDGLAKLSGTPDLLLTFTNPQILTDCAFHPCVRLQRWLRDKALSFVPPDGRFILAEYRYQPPQAGIAAGAAVIQIPIMLKPMIEVEDSGGNISITLSSRLSTRTMENVAVEIYLGEDASGVQCTTSSSGTSSASGIPIADGSWAFNPRRKILRWEVPFMGTSGAWSIRGTWSSKSTTPRPEHAFRVYFDIPSHSFSSLKVDQLRISGENYKPYKGIRARSSGCIEWRW